jgi:hypothetical protein
MRPGDGLYPPVPDAGHFRHWPTAALLRRAGDVVGDAELRRGQVQRADDGALISQGPGVHHAVQFSPDNDMTTSDNLRPGVDVANDDDVAGVLNPLAGADGPLHHQSTGRHRRGFLLL